MHFALSASQKSRSHDDESEASRLHDIYDPRLQELPSTQAAHSETFLSYTTLHFKETSTRTSRFLHRMIREIPRLSVLLFLHRKMAKKCGTQRSTAPKRPPKTNLSGFSRFGKQKLDSAASCIGGTARGLNPRSTNLHNGREKATIHFPNYLITLSDNKL